MKYDKLIISGDIAFDKPINIDRSLDFLAKKNTAFCANIEGSINIYSENRFKVAPKIKFSKNATVAMNNIGVTHYNFYNNHANDYGKKNLEYFQTKIRENGGNIINQYEIFNIKDIKVGLISTQEYNEHAQNDESIYFFDKRIKNIIDTAKLDCDYIILQCHAGLEKVMEPLEIYERYYKRFVDMGVNLVVGHHPHIVQRIEYYKKGIIAYSLGDFIFNLKNIPRYSNIGLLCSVSFEGKKPLVSFIYTGQASETIFVQQNSIKYTDQASLSINDTLSYLTKYIDFCLCNKSNLNLFIAIGKEIRSRFLGKGTRQHRQEKMLFHLLNNTTYRFLIENKLPLKLKQLIHKFNDK